MANILESPQSQNPAKFTVEWKGSEGQFVYYDKEAKTRIPLTTPIYGVIVADSFCIRGFDNKTQKGIYSNECQHSDDTLNVRIESQTVLSGKYKEIKEKIKAIGGKYARIAYIVVFEKETAPYLAKFIFVGSSLTPYIEGKFAPAKKIISLSKNPTPKKNGATTYFEPLIKVLPDEKQNKDAIEKAMPFAVQVLDFFKSKNGVIDAQQQKVEYTIYPTDEDESFEATTEDNLPF